MAAAGIDAVSVVVPYKVVPRHPNHPRASQEDGAVWVPVLTVSLIAKHTETKRFEAVVDSGAATCLFHAQIGLAIGLDIRSGAPGPIGGVIAQARSTQYFHNVKIKWMGHLVPVWAGFCEDLSVGAILGRDGFFDQFTITFSPCSAQSGMVIERFHSA